MFEFASTEGIAQLLAADGTNVYKSTGGAFSVAFAYGGVVRATTFKNRLYCVSGVLGSKRWDGAIATDLGVSHNDDLEAPTATGTAGNMPIAALIATHQGHVWVANTTEGGTSYPSRVRFSHPNFAEDWRTEDFIDVAPGVDGDEITAIVPYADRLLVFKRRSVHAVFGSDPETFQVFTVSNEIGAISQDAVVGTDVGVYFFSWPDGIFLYDGKAPMWQSERIFPAIQDGKVPQVYADQIHLGWGNRRLWVSVPWMGSQSRSWVFVLNPALSKKGSWVAYDLKIGPFVEWNPPGANALLLAGHMDTARVLMLDQRVAVDNFGGDDVPIVSSYRTAWIDFDSQATKKRWRRPDVILRGGTTATIRVRAYHDWDATFAAREFQLNVASDSDDSSTVTTDPTTGESVGSGWGSATWGVSSWGRSGVTSGVSSEIVTEGRNELHRGSPLGTSHAVSLEFVGPVTESEWGVESIALKLVNRPLRS